MPYGEPEHWRDPARQRDVPLLVACYRLLAQVATGLDRPVHVCMWEHPWIRTIGPTERGAPRRARLPAAAVLANHNTDGVQQLLLLPDVGTAPLASYRPTLRALIELRRTALITKEEDEPLLIVGVATPPRSSSARTEAWQSLLEDVARRGDELPLRACVVDLGGSLTNRRDRDRCSPGQSDEVFAMIARHPLLTRQQLASLLHTSAVRIARLEAALMESGWLRTVTVDSDLPRSFRGPTSNQIRRLGLAELTDAGRQEAARRILVPAGLARRRHGITRSDASRRRLIRHLQHTVGTNAFFVALAAAATQATSRGRDDALIEWRSAVACARGRFRPDGYGCYQRGQSQFGFFLEYDRGTEKPSQYAAKLAAYYRFRDSGAAALEYAGFPTVLVVTTREAAELRFAHEAFVASERHGGKPLSLLLTRTDVIEATREGILGPVWRTPGRYGERQLRAYWLPGGPPHESFSLMAREVSRGDR